MSRLKKYSLPITVLFFIVTIGVFGPLELYITNNVDLWFSFRNTLIISLIMSGIGLLIAGGIALLLPRKYRGAYSAVLFALTLCLYLQGNYINISYGVLDGNAIDWSAYTGYAIADTLFWIAVFAVVLLLWKKKAELLRSIQTYGSLLIISMQVITLVYLTASSGVLVQEEPDQFLSTNHMYEISAQDNVIIFVLDAFDQAFMEEILAEEPETYQTLFKDFTMFNNAATGGHSTWAGMPAMITGKSYAGGVRYAEYVENEFDSDGLYSTLKDRGYNISLFTDNSYVPKNNTESIDNMVSSSFGVSSYTGLTKTYSSFTLYKYMPHILKQFFWLYTGDFDAYRDGGGVEHYAFDDVAFYENLVNRKLTLTDSENALRLYHLEGPHPPFDMNEYAQATEESSIQIQAKGCLYIVEEYLNQMKELGVYDNSMIIITADHGQVIPGHPILLVKDRGTQQTFSESSAPVSHFDMHNTIFSYIGEDMGDTFFDIPEHVDRKRYYSVFNSEGNKISMIEYLIDGDLHDADNVSATGVIYEPNDIQLQKYKYYEVLSFGTDSTAIDYTLAGISFASTGFAWTDGYEVIFSIPLEDAPYADLDVYIYMVAVMTDAGPQIINIYANDQLVHETTREDTTPLAFKVPAELIKEDCVLNLRIELPNATCLTDLYGPGNDPRTLGLAITSMVIVDPGRDYGLSAKITNALGMPLSWLLEKCHNVTGSYVLAIFLFTLLTKVILLPVSLWTNKNGIIMIKMMPELNRLKVKYYGDKESISDETQALYQREKYNPIASSVPMIIQIILLMGVIGAVKKMLGSDTASILNAIPSETGGMTLMMPVLAALAALALGIGQNLLNPLQKEQTKRDQWFTNGVSIAISLFLGAFVSVGTCVYWIASNLFTIPFQALMNLMMPPEKYVDYAALEESRQELAVLDSLKEEVSKEDKKREKRDYKRFFSVANKHLVFYSERSGFYKYFQNIIAYLLEHSNIIIHYVTNDPKDQIFEIAKSEPRIRPYYIGQQKIITLMMKMDADMVITTTHELDTYYLKRSYVRKDIEYIYVPHAMVSTNMTSNKGCVDHYDTVFCVGKHQLEELREAEEMYGTSVKNLIPVSYGMLDNMLEAYEKMPKEEHKQKRILIAPSWQEDNLLDSCIDQLVEQLYDPKHFVVARPHPEYVKRFPGKIKALQEKFKDLDPNLFLFETDFSSNVSIYTADMLITDWSGIVQEFCYTTKKPGLMINTPMKVMNPEYTRYKNLPLDITMRNILGKTLEMNELDKTRETVEELFSSAEFYEQQITDMTEEYVYNIGESGRIGGRYILKRLMERDMEREAEKK